MAIDIGNATPVLDIGDAQPTLDLGNSKPIDLKESKSVLDIGQSKTNLNLGSSILLPQHKGFFETLRNPIDLMYNESLVRMGYNYMTGDTQEVQAKRAQEFIQNNPSLKGTPEYQDAEIKLERYGYLLDSGQPFSLEALQEAVKANPGQMTGELVNAFVADPYLVFTPWLLGGNALAKFYQANKILGKVPRIAKGAAYGTIATPEATAYSIMHQLGTKGEVDANRVAVDTAIGGTAGLGFGIAFGGGVNHISRQLNEGLDDVQGAFIAKVKRASEGDLEAQRELTIDSKLKDNVDVPEGLHTMLEDNVSNLKENRWAYSDKNAMALYNGIRSTLSENFRKLTVDMNETALLRKMYDNSTGPLVAGAVFGAGGALATGEAENAAFVGASALGLATFGKTASKAFSRYQNIEAGKFATQARKSRVPTFKTQSDYNAFKKELYASGVKLKDLKIKSNISFYKSNKVRDQDFAYLGQAKRLNDQVKGIAISRNAIDGYDQYIAVGGSVSHKLNVLFNKEHPIPLKDRQLKVLRFSQSNRKERIAQQKNPEERLTTDEIQASKSAEKYFNEAHKFLRDEGILVPFRKNFLPGFWQKGAMTDDLNFAKMFDEYFLKSAKSKEYKGTLATEKSKKIDSYAKGIEAGLEPKTTNLGEIIALYNNALYRAIGERRLKQTLYNGDIVGRNTRKNIPAKFMYTTADIKRSGANIDDYVIYKDESFLMDSKSNHRTLNKIGTIIEKQKFSNPKEAYEMRKALIKQADDAGSINYPWVFREAAPHLKMLIDSKQEEGLFRAISNLNFLQKRLSVGYSFFHAAALMESMIFAGVKTTKVLNVAGFGKIPGINYFVPKVNSAKRMINEGGNYDDYQVGLRSGVVFSHPEDIGYHRFYDLLNGAQRVADKIGGPFAKYLVGQGIDKLVVKPFKFIDDVTWDHVYNSGKLYTFQTSRIKMLNDPKFTGVPLKEINRKAAKFTNDAYGGLNWRQLYEDTTNPILKAVAGKAFTPSGRKYLQLIAFAPDWTIANLRILGNALPGFNKDPLSRKLYQAYALRAGLIYATFGSALQYMFTGKTLLENKDPTKIDLGNGYNMVFSKQLMEPLHWAVHPYKTLVSKQGSTSKLVQQLLFNKKYLTSPYPSPISEEDLFSLYRARDYGLQVGESFIPFSFRTPIQQMMKDGVQYQDAINYLLGNFGHPVYPIGRDTKYFTGQN